MGTPITTGGEDNTTASATDANNSDPEVIAHSEPEDSLDGTPITTGGDDGQSESQN